MYLGDILSLRVIPVVTSRSPEHSDTVCHCDPESFTYCHSECSEESHGAQDRLREWGESTGDSSVATLPQNDISDPSLNSLHRSAIMSEMSRPLKTGIANLPLHVGKDGQLFPVDRETYDTSIDLLGDAV